MCYLQQAVSCPKTCVYDLYTYSQSDCNLCIKTLIWKVFSEGDVDLYESFHKILLSSKAVNIALGDDLQVIMKIKTGLTDESSDAAARLKLIEMLRDIYECHRNPKQLISQHALITLLQDVLDDEVSGIVTMAKKLLRAFDVQKNSP